MAEQKLPDKAQENEMKREKVRVVPIKYIDDSPDHPFQVRDDEEMMSLVESIATFGVITPIIARKTADERYELISGHRRKPIRRKSSEYQWNVSNHSLSAGRRRV